jgi:hypothetical protein
VTRALYRTILWLHPPAFRKQYAGEMLWIYDQFALEGSTSTLMSDAVVSLLRQWLVRSRLWMVSAALAGAMLTILSGNALLHFIFSRIRMREAASPQELFLFTVALSLLTVAFTLIAAVLPVLRARRRRA